MLTIEQGAGGDDELLTLGALEVATYFPLLHEKIVNDGVFPSSKEAEVAGVATVE